MQCEKFEVLWNEALDARQAPEENPLLVAHATECRQCAEMLSLSESLLLGLEARPAVEPSADFAERVLAEFNRPAPLVSRPAMVFALLAMAAAIAVVVGLQWQSKSSHNPAAGGAPEFALDKPAPADPEDPFARRSYDPAVDKLAPVLDSLPGLNEDYLSVLRHTGTAVALFPGQVRRATLSEEPGLVADRIRPVAQPMTAAINALRRTLPGSASDMPGMSDDAKSSAYPRLLHEDQRIVALVVVFEELELS